MGTVCPPRPETGSVCPFHEAAPRCPHRPARCTSEDHDECPTYLAKMLRQLRPRPFQVQRDLWTK